MSKITLTPLTSLGQIKIGDKMILSDGKNVTNATAKDLYAPLVGTIEVILRKRSNKFFNVNMFLSGQSWVKECFVVTVEGDEK